MSGLGGPNWPKNHRSIECGMYEVRHRPNVDLDRSIPDSVFLSFQRYMDLQINDSSPVIKYTKIKTVLLDIILNGKWFIFSFVGQ